MIVPESLIRVRHTGTMNRQNTAPVTKGIQPMPAHDPDELLRQFHHNQSSWVTRLATGQVNPDPDHPRVFQIGETLAMLPGAAGVIMLPLAGEPDTVLDEHAQVLHWLRTNHPRDVLVWNMQPDPKVDLALLAQGYASSFEPWWMTRDLDAPIPAPNHLIREVNALDILKLKQSDVPYIIQDQLDANRALSGGPGNPPVIWLAAIVDDEPVGHAIVNVVDDHAGLFNVGVSGKHRFKGIGTSLTLAAMQAAHDRGAMTMNLNSTPAGKKLYDRLGFRQFGTGQTWLRSGRMVHRTPDPSEQSLVMAIGTGDLARIHIDPVRHRHLQCRLTPQELAARFGQKESLLEIIRQGMTPDIISLWRVGLRDEAIAAASDPAARELISGARRAHPIHHAIEMGAGTLVMELIAAGANLNARDAEFNATPLDWAQATNKPTIARIIRQAGGG